MKITFLDAKTLGNDICFDEFHCLGETVVYQTTTPDEMGLHIDNSDVVIVNKIKLNEQTLKHAHNLKLICVAATGFDNIDLEYCKNNNIAVCNVVGYSTHSVAQVALTMALSLATHLPEYNAFVHDGSYTKGGVANYLIPVYHELCGKVWGVVGLGNIGKQVARVAESMGCRVIGYKRTPDSEFECCCLEDLCKTADIISIHLPLSEETKGIIDKNMIASMKKDAIVINVSRGAVTDEQALAEAVLNHHIGGLGVDVYSTEPFPKEHPFSTLLGLPNVCLTPHMAWGAYESRARCMHEIACNIKAYFYGESRNRLV